MFSVYSSFFSGEGPRKRNLDILHTLAAHAQAIRGPVLIAGDWNMDGSTLSATGWPEIAGLTLVTPDEPTCGTNKIDYFALPP